MPVELDPAEDDDRLFEREGLILVLLLDELGFETEGLEPLFDVLAPPRLGRVYELGELGLETDGLVSLIDFLLRLGRVYELGLLGLETDGLVSLIVVLPRLGRV